MSDNPLQQKLDALLKRKDELESRLGSNKSASATSSRKSDVGYRLDSGSGAQARTKQTDEVMLRSVNLMIQRVRTQLAQ